MEKTFLDYFHLPSDLALWLTLSGSNYPCLEQISMVPKMFEPLKFDCSNLVIVWTQLHLSEIYKGHSLEQERTLT